MSITIPTVYIYNIKTRTILTKSIENIRDKWIGDYSCGLEKKNIEYIKKEFKL